jgi:hypothetical protein
VGFIEGYDAGGREPAIRQGLDQTGYFEGKNVAIEYRWYDRLPGWRL